MRSVVVIFLLFFSGCTLFDRLSEQSNKNPKNYFKSPSISLTEANEEPESPIEKVKVPFRRQKLNKKVSKYCKKVDKQFSHWGWGRARCDDYPWHHVRDSHLGDPLIWLTYGETNVKKIKSTTLILCGVHGDEITPVKFCFDIINEVQSNADLYSENLIVIAPIVNPDSFFKRRPTRTNFKGVDINRNFPTKDWDKDALKLWKKRYRKDKRRYPGKKAMSEPEVYFQVNLIRRYRPDKIISVHAPLTMIDYDGPDFRFVKGKNSKLKGKKANELLIQMSKQSSGYRIKNYPFFPGSLGNWAGNERGIPTYTLELPSSDNRNSKKYWRLFQNAIRSALLHDFQTSPDTKDGDVVSKN
jgi:protein MpaA